jgi:hypothetical protein
LWISPCVWPNSGFWCCVSLSLPITLMSGFTLVTKKVGSRSYTVLGGYHNFMIPVPIHFHTIWYPRICFSLKRF